MATPVVLVTGASSGIGAAIARRVARDRRNVALVARRADRLDALASELTRDHGIEAFALPVDLVRADGPPSIVAEVDRRGLEVEWLVNNAGIGTLGRVDRLPVEGELDEIRLNVEALVALTGAFLPGMVARRRGAVVNVASVAGFGPMSYTATYAATKAFVIAFSEAIAVELEGTGVHVLCVCPGFTRTEFQDAAGIDTSGIPGLAWMSADAVADETVRAVGSQTVLVNGVMNRAMAAGLRLAPRGLVARLTALTNRRGPAAR
jgi:short-subunit dehydrogenase